MDRNVLLLILCLSCVVPLTALDFPGGQFEMQMHADIDKPGEAEDQVYIYNELRLFMTGSPNRNLEIRNIIKTPWMRFNDPALGYKDVLDTFFWSTILEFKSSYPLSLTFGNQPVNWSPYIFYSEPWQDAFFKGLGAYYDQGNIHIESFIGMHSQSSNPDVYPEQGKKDIGYFYNHYNSSDALDQKPTVWGGFNAKYIIPDVAEMQFLYAHESLSMQTRDYGFHFYEHEILLAHVLISPLSWISADLSAALFYKHIMTYKGYWDFWAPGIHLTKLDYTERDQDSAWHAGLTLVNPLKDKILQMGQEISFLYRQIGPDYTPVHWDNGIWNENRGEDILDNMENDQAGYIISVKQPVLTVLSLGGEHRSFSDHAQVVTKQETRLELDVHGLLDRIDLSVIYRLRSLDGAVFGNSKDNLNGFYVRGTVKISPKNLVELIYDQHRDLLINYHQILLRVHHAF